MTFKRIEHYSELFAFQNIVRPPPIKSEPRSAFLVPDLWKKTFNLNQLIECEEEDEHNINENDFDLSNVSSSADIYVEESLRDQDQSTSGMGRENYRYSNQIIRKEIL